jgi:hypothetical protein
MRVRVSVVTALVAAFVFSPPVSADSNGVRVEASVDGQRIDAADIADFYCHDFAFPHIHCFRTARELEAALVDGSIAASFGPSDYVTIYSEPSVYRK